MRTKRVGRMRRVSLTLPVSSLHKLLVQKTVIDKSVWLLTAGEAKKEKNGAEEEADGQPVKRPAEEEEKEVGLAFRCISQHFRHLYLI